jgi:hypothetical protein
MTKKCKNCWKTYYNPYVVSEYCSKKCEEENNNGILTLKNIQDAIKNMKAYKKKIYYRQNKKIFWHDTCFPYNVNMEIQNNNK